ncbi:MULTISPECIES: hypothetical protein [unclassified Methylophilus]|uniref:hypothetical protein n=1 Tax=unclassified Methylophilus TaxID=2630143 RepID=UPI00188E4D94|nr:MULTISPECIES: hypothetical protein [unclassified Methylophilus]MBF5039216.1 hypothetical protein [Methylophilus sp. 13]MDF0377381.1 hypothetical protein [Methylophilus sp. YYY-1]MDT7849454.1 hypothetical protein [Methylophilus sp. VKM B-3414]BEV08659.1 VanZ family protein [Methylophilus sp. DW102]
MRFSLIAKIIFIACLALLTYLLLIEMAPAEQRFPYLDKIQHIVAFGGVTFWAGLAYPARQQWLMLGLLIYGGLMEVLQGLLTVTRQPSVYDWLADSVGILLAWGVVILCLRWWQHRRG